MKASTIIQYFVLEDRVDVELEIGAVDLVAFRRLLPDELYDKLDDTPRPLAERLPEFFRVDLPVLVDGSPLPGAVKAFEVRRRLVRDEITGKPLSLQPDDVEKVLYFRLEYRWDKRPENIAIRPPKRERAVAANIGFVLYHLGVPVNDFRYLGAAETVDLDWSDPWYSRFRSRNLKRQFDAPLSVFLYVDHFEVRKELVLRPKDLQQWVDLGLDGKDTIGVEQQDEIKEKVAELLRSRGRVLVDGQEVEGRLDRIHFLRRTLKGTQVIDPPEPLDAHVAELGVIFVYPIADLPKDVELTWDLFSPKIVQVPAMATDEAGGMPSMLTSADPKLTWKNFLTDPSRPSMMEVAAPEPNQISLPIITLFCGAASVLAGVVWMRRGGNAAAWTLMATAVIAAVGYPFARVSVNAPFDAAPTIEGRQSRELMHALLHNVYRAFDRRDEDVVYDSLSRTITGDLLSDVYLQIRASTELANQGGARVRIDDVEIIDLKQIQASEGLSFRCRWNASGAVGHWGHIHRRTNQYDADITIRPEEDRWKITEIDVRDEVRLDPSRARSNSSP